MPPAFQFLVPIGMGILCAVLAEARGRSRVAWFFIGLLTQVLGLILLLVLPDEHQRKELARENHRLRERLRMDQTVAERRHRDVERRLARHDRVLGMDTRAPVDPAEAVEAGAHAVIASAPATAVEDPPSGDPEELRWFYAREGRPSEAIDVHTLRDLWRRGEVGADTLVWNKFLTGWQTIASIPGLEAELSA